MSWWSKTETGVRLTIRVVPRGSRTAVAGLHGDALKIRLQAPPVDGAANEALIKFLADTLDVPRSSIQLVRGHTGRSKEIWISGDPEVIQPERLLPR
ncbi:MAG: DUF167 domain-containing protein [Kiritimatiellae bacterium]|nr:DUF167 domain-containing protein [Kiritimatiellia bacterium]